MYASAPDERPEMGTPKVTELRRNGHLLGATHDSCALCAAGVSEEHCPEALPREDRTETIESVLDALLAREVSEGAALAITMFAARVLHPYATAQECEGLIVRIHAEGPVWS